MTIIKDGRILKALAKKCGFEYDKQYKYITVLSYDAERKLKQMGYVARYLDGCFCPYVVKMV